MQLRAVAVVVVLLLGVCAGAFAQAQLQEEDQISFGRRRGPAQSIIGPTGMVVAPTADVVGDRRVQVGYHAFAMDRGNVDFSVPKINVGAGSCWEFTAAWFDVDGYPERHDCVTQLDRCGESRHLWPIWEDTEFIWGFKCKLHEESKNSPAVSVGVWDVGDKIDLSAYAVASKTLFGDSWMPVKVNAGFASGDEVFSDFFGGLSLQPVNWLDWVVEHDGHKWNVMWRFYPWRNLLVEGGWQDLMDSQWIAGASWYWEY
jgi:hypothetical protein